MGLVLSVGLFLGSAIWSDSGGNEWVSEMTSETRGFDLARLVLKPAWLLKQPDIFLTCLHARQVFQKITLSPSSY